MPYVNVRVAGKLTREQKEEIAKGITGVISKSTGKSPESHYIVFDEVDRENWAKGEQLLG